jgi:hypothetical protein
MTNPPLSSATIARMDENPYKAPQESLKADPMRNELCFRIGLILLAALITFTFLAFIAPLVD